MNLPSMFTTMNEPYNTELSTQTLSETALEGVQEAPATVEGLFAAFAQAANAVLPPIEGPAQEIVVAPDAPELDELPGKKPKLKPAKKPAKAKTKAVGKEVPPGEGSVLKKLDGHINLSDAFEMVEMVKKSGLTTEKPALVYDPVVADWITNIVGGVGDAEESPPLDVFQQNIPPLPQHLEDAVKAVAHSNVKVPPPKEKVLLEASPYPSVPQYAQMALDAAAMKKEEASLLGALTNEGIKTPPGTAKKGSVGFGMGSLSPAALAAFSSPAASAPSQPVPEIFDTLLVTPPAAASNAPDVPTTSDQAFQYIEKALWEVRNARALHLELAVAAALAEDDKMPDWQELPTPSPTFSDAGCPNCVGKLTPIEHPKQGQGWRCLKCNKIWKDSQTKANPKKVLFDRINAVRTLMLELDYDIDMALYTVDMAGAARVLHLVQKMPILLPPHKEAFLAWEKETKEEADTGKAFFKKTAPVMAAPHVGTQTQPPAHAVAVNFATTKNTEGPYSVGSLVKPPGPAQDADTNLSLKAKMEGYVKNTSTLSPAQDVALAQLIKAGVTPEEFQALAQTLGQATPDVTGEITWTTSPKVLSLAQTLQKNPALANVLSGVAAAALAAPAPAKVAAAPVAEMPSKMKSKEIPEGHLGPKFPTATSEIFAAMQKMNQAMEDLTGAASLPLTYNPIDLIPTSPKKG